MDSLTRLFCPPGNYASIPTPADVRAYLMPTTATSVVSSLMHISEDGDEHLRIMIPPEVGTQIPDDILERIEGARKSGERPPLRRWRVTFISDRGEG